MVDAAAFNEPVAPYREPPSSPDAEQALLGTVLINNDAIHQAPFLSPNHFFLPVHGRIFQHCHRLIDRGSVVTPITLQPYFDADDALADVGGVQYLSNLAAAATSATNIRDYAAIIHEMFMRRELLDIGHDLIDAVHEATIDDQSEQQIETAERALFALMQRGGGLNPTVNAGQSFESTFSDLEAAIARGDALAGLNTGIRDLDYAIGGLQPGKLIVVAGRPGMGKSALAVNIAEAASITTPTLYLSGEMDHTEIMQRILAARTGITYQAISRADIAPDERDRIAARRPEIASLALQITPLVNLTADDICGRVRRAIRTDGIGLVIVDHLGHVRPRNDRAMRVHQIEEITGALKALALDTGIPIVLLSQLNRAVEGRDDKRPAMADLRDSGSIEQDADQIIFVFRQAYYDEQKIQNNDYGGMADVMAAKNQMTLLVRKNRGGMSPLDLDVPVDMATNRFCGRV